MTAKIVSVANQKGGVGKTTTAINLAAGIAKRLKSVLLVDMDGQGNSTQGLGIDKAEIKNTIYELIMGESSIEDVIISAEDELLDIIPANMNLSGAKIELIGLKDREYRLKKELTAAKDSYDYIIIDSPPSLDLLTINALTASDSVLIPIQCEYYALEGLGQLLNTIEMVKNGLNADLAVEGVLLTMFDARTNLSTQVMQNIQEHFEGAVYSSVIPRNVRLAEAPSFGKSIFDYDLYCSGAVAYRDFTDEFLELGSAIFRR